jgi:NAD-dependent SIR2 family protein deacetylase
MKYTKNFLQGDYPDKLEKVSRLLKEAEHLLVGIGSGLSASGGLDYTDSSLIEKWYPSYYQKGYRSLFQILSTYWTIENSDIQAYWGFWAQHILHVRYEPKALPIYIDLFELLKDREYGIITTNVDGQLEKAGFPKEKIFAPQGDYALFQCSRSCTEDVYDNKELVATMLSGLFENNQGLPCIKKEDIPLCPHCKSLLKPNLRSDDTFVEKPHLAHYSTYKTYVQRCAESNERTLLLELGVGYNSPGVIRYPFEQMALFYPHFDLVRVNREDPELLEGLGDRSVSVAADLGKFLPELSASLITTKRKAIV